MALDPNLQTLLDYEAEVLNLIAAVNQEHRALQDTGYDRDLRVLRGTLDRWMELYSGASYYLALSKQEVRAARYRHRKAWQAAVQRPTGLPDRHQSLGSYEERKVVYEIASDDEFRTLDILERVADTITEFKFLLKFILEHWNARRADVKFEAQTEQRIPGADYASPDPS